jgi:dihydropteroate synthase
MSNAERISALEKLLSQESPQIMGVLNVTPDSFSDGGLHLGTDPAVDRARGMLAEGAAIVDIGGESTAPGSKPVSAEEELRRIDGAVRALAGECILSIDTYKAATAEACLAAGAAMINDVSALRADPRMTDVLRESGAFVVLMHSQQEGREPHAGRAERHYRDVTAEVADFLRARVDAALSGGIAERRIVLDPGMGRFVSHLPEYSWTLLAELDRLIGLVRPFPVLVGPSRKGFLGGKLAERDAVSQLAGLAAALKGAKIVRTHCPGMAREFLSAWARLH